MVRDFLESVWAFVDGFPVVLQFFAVFVLAMIPFIETELAAILGVLLGIPIPLVIIASAGGTILTTIAVAALGGKASDKLTKGKRGEKARGRAERYGIPVGMLLGSLTFSTPITALILTTAGLNRRAVVGWGIVWSIVLAIAISLLTWGVTFVVYEAGS